MAQVVLYPVSDQSLRHSCSNGSVGWSLINDAVGASDDGSAYIYQQVSSSSRASASSVFVMSESNVTRKIYLTSVSCTYRMRVSDSELTATCTPAISINGRTKVNGTRANATTGWTDYNSTFSNPQGINTKYDSFAAANIQLTLTTSGNNTSNKNSREVDITQAYVTAEYLPYYNFAAVNVEGCNSVSVSGAEIREGDSATFTATVPSNYSFLGWFSDSSCQNRVSTNTAYTISNVSADNTLYAKAVPTYSVSVNADEYCTVSVNPSTGVQGTQITATATPIDNMKEFVGWYTNVERTNLVSTSNPYVFSLNSDTVLYAKFKLKYEMFLKIGGIWQKCTSVYKKIDGQWVLQENLDGLLDPNKNYIKNDV